MRDDLDAIALDPGTAPGGLRGVLAAATRCETRGLPFALALVVETEGSTYRKPGAMALFGADGTRRGALSGGCLEPELERLALEAIAGGAPKLAEFDTQHDADLVFGSGSGCRGLMRVLLLPASCGAIALLDAARGAAQERSGLRFAFLLDPAELGRGLLRYGERVLPIGQATSAASFDALLAACDLPQRSAAPASHRIAAGSIAPPPRALLFGAGPETQPLALLLRCLGWFVDLADHRPALACRERLPDVDRILIARPARALHDWQGPAPDAAIVMTHLAGNDLEALRALAAGTVAYVALLGPPARRDELLARLDAGERASLAPRLRAPAGLPLGGEGAECIALSIAAGLQQFLATRVHVG